MKSLRAEPTPTADLRDPTPCAHCGLPAPAPEGDAPAFCCNGCRAVYAMMRDVGLDDFYRLRDRLGEAPAGRPVDDAPGDFAHFDDADFQTRFAPDGRSIELHLDGVHCAACVWVMDQLPRVAPGVTAARLDFGRERLHLAWDPARTRLSDVAAVLHGLGYAPSPVGVEAERARRAAGRGELIRIGAMAAVAGNAMMVAAALYAGAFSGMEARFERFFEWVSLILALPAVTYGAWPFYRGAWSGLRMRVAHIDLPIALGIGAGFLASLWATVTGQGEVYYDSVTALVFLLLVGRFVQTRGQRAALGRAELLAAMTPGSAWRWDGADWVRVPAGAVRVGDRVRVRSGETAPVDALVLRGHGHFDQSMLTGESRPVPAGPGDSVFAGTVSVGEVIEVEATASGAETRLGRLVELIERAEAERPPLVQLVDRISGAFVVTVVVLAVAGGVWWWFHDPSRVFDVVVSMLVVSCPCALGLATPLALAVARGRAAAAGVLLRNTAAIERLARVRRVWFDKTGTLTAGRMQVTRAWVPAEWRAAVGVLERGSTHLIARAVAAWAGGEGTATEVVETPGRGIEGVVEGHRVRVGGSDVGERFAQQLADVLAAGETPVAVHVDDRPVGLIALGDRVRDDSADAVDRLRAMGLRVGLLSGDHPAVVRAVGDALGLEDALGGHPPEDKARVVAEGGAAAMVGDGFNDAAALRAASVGVAVHGGAEVAMQVADVYLDRPGPTAVVDAIEGARRTLTVVRRNLVFSLCYNAVFATLALTGYVSPLAAAILMPISSLTVVASSTLGRTFRRVDRGA